MLGGPRLLSLTDSTRPTDLRLLSALRDLQEYRACCDRTFENLSPCLCEQRQSRKSKQTGPKEDDISKYTIQAHTTYLSGNICE